jgi:hypothetical protein
MNILDTRIRMAAESILENEALRDGLYDEQAASALLNWGVTWAEYLALQTAHIADEQEAEDEIYPRMKALRKLLVAVKDLAIAEGWTLEAVQQGLQEAFNYAQVLNGAAWQAPTKIDDETWLILQEGESLARVNNLRALIAGTQETPPTQNATTQNEPINIPNLTRDATQDDAAQDEEKEAQEAQDASIHEENQPPEGFFARWFKRR